MKETNFLSVPIVRKHVVIDFFSMTFCNVFLSKFFITFLAFKWFVLLIYPTINFWNVFWVKFELHVMHSNDLLSRFFPPWTSKMCFWAKFVIHMLHSNDFFSGCVSDRNLCHNVAFKWYIQWIFSTMDIWNVFISEFCITYVTLKWFFLLTKL